MKSVVMLMIYLLLFAGCATVTASDTMLPQSEEETEIERVTAQNHELWSALVEANYRLREMEEEVAVANERFFYCQQRMLKTL